VIIMAAAGTLTAGVFLLHPLLAPDLNVRHKSELAEN
jgi:hypothetical protein